MQEQLDSSKYLKQHIDNMADSATPICAKCNSTIRPRQHILECDRCLRSLHRTCVPDCKLFYLFLMINILLHNTEFIYSCIII